jgi:hypothetical protein
VRRSRIKLGPPDESDATIADAATVSDIAESPGVGGTVHQWDEPAT